MPQSAFYKDQLDQLVPGTILINFYYFLLKSNLCPIDIYIIKQYSYVNYK